ncbi:MAG TPA: menaquinone biosynthesis protein [Planctomycetota bacterium]|nr:menaquinone biosynthesis protein [Planctomycetota bacterium]
MNARAIRVGAPPYVVARPLLYGLDEEPGIELVEDVPSRLVEGLRAGTLDVALASSVEIFRRGGYAILPGLCIGADGESGSVKLYTRRSFPSIRAVSLDAASRSASALVRTLLASWTPHRIDYRDLPSGVDGASDGTDAFLRIGDEALRATTPQGYEEVDLAAAWKELTGLPMVFALWIVRPGADLGGLEKAFANAARRGLEARKEIAEEAARETGLPVELLRRYLLEAGRYDLDGKGMTEGLLAFRDHGAAAGVCRADLKVQRYKSPAPAKP